MNTTDKKIRYTSASIVSRLMHWWLLGTFKVARQRSLTEDDVAEPIHFLSTSYNVDKFERSWNRLSEEEVNKEGSLLWHLVVHFKDYMILGTILCFIPDLCKFLSLLALRYLVEYSQGTLDISATTSWLILSGAVMSIMVYGFFGSNCSRVGQLMEMRMKLILSALIYNKVLKLSHGSLSEVGSGHIVNLMSADVESINRGIRRMCSWFYAPVLLTIILGFECYDIGPAILLMPAIVSLAILMLYQLGKISGKLRCKQARWTDKRVQLLHEVIVAMKVVKMYCWEEPFSYVANTIRRSEMAVQFLRSLMVAFSIVCGFPFVKCTTFIITVTLLLSGHTLTTGQRLSLVGNVGLLSLPFFTFATSSFINYKEMKATTDRIKTFLQREEKTISDCSKGTVAMSMSDLTVSWPSISTQGNKQFSLQAVDLIAKQGEVVAVVGQVGSGKSTLLTACLGELEVTKGSCDIYGTISYAPQEPWILSETVRDNILLGNKFDEPKYKTVLSACALIEDIEQMPDGDQTLVGERGLTLSGGQKARIGLARAVYHDADIYLLDDPLSSVDGKVANQIFFECIQNLLKAKVRILATHQTSILGHADKVILLDKGCMVKCGTYNEMADLVKKYVEVESKEDMDLLSQPLYTSSDDNYKCTAFATTTKKVDRNERGSVRFNVYLQYMKYGHGTLFIPLFLFFIILALGSGIFHDLLLIQWRLEVSNNTVNASDAVLPKLLNQAGLRSDSGYLETIGLSLLVAIIAHLAAYTFIVYMYKAAGENIYNYMFLRLMKAPLHFFETNPVGQVLNRFSRDTTFMDIHLLYPLITCIVTVITPMVDMVYVCIVNPWCLIPLLTFILMVVVVTRQLLPGFRETKRIEASLRSPMYSHLSTTLEGLMVIRAMKKEKDFLKEAYAYMDRHSSAWFHHVCTERAYSLAVDLMAALLISLSVIVLLLNAEMGSLDASVGLAFIYLPKDIADITAGCMFFALVEVIMTSIERILQYGKLEQEAPDGVESRPPQGWPHQGSISLTDVSLKYHQQQQTALGPVNINIRAGEKIGVVGRTGAGKSSLITCLLRLVEPQGSLVIDGVNIKSIGLADLRRVISVIPQDPVLFSQSLRYNLDPFDEYTDDKVWGALTNTRLSSKVKQLPGQLMAEMGESGSNFSVGEKQLLCLARAIMRGNKIVLIDEATANVDNRTDEMIQTTLRDALLDATVITIAHRLNTLVAVDRIMVLEQGKVIELGIPYSLLQQGSGAFYDMVSALGEANLTQLMNATHTYTQGKARLTCDVRKRVSPSDSLHCTRI